MGEFHRSPSKVWWAGEDSLNFRAASASPGSQDSGFSDTETSPPGQIQKILHEEFIKNGGSLRENLTKNIIEKLTPDKKKIGNKSARSYYYIPNDKTPQRRPRYCAKTEPVNGRAIVGKLSPKVSRNLFRSIQMQADQNARDGDEGTEGSVCSEVTSNENISWHTDGSDVLDSVKTLPTVRRSNRFTNLSAPAVLCPEDEAITAFNQSISDCESELESLLKGALESPMHTSTPKASSKRQNVRLLRANAMKVPQKYKNDRVPPIYADSVEEGTALQVWMKELHNVYEPEIMTTLQCKSIAGELLDKVNKSAEAMTAQLRILLYYNYLIRTQIDAIKNQKSSNSSQIQNLTSTLMDLLRKLSRKSSTLEQLCKQLELSQNEEIIQVLSSIHSIYIQLYQQILVQELKLIISSLEAPKTELEVRAGLTAVTSLALHHDYLIENFVNLSAIQVITILCEKCEGSSVRTLAFRALTTLCVNAAAIRMFEKSDGLQVISDTISEDSRPEPERIEAIALLAQITAPWIEDNHNITGLRKQSKSLVKNLTKITKTIRCCQNLLLCIAALANLIAMDIRSVKYVLQQNTIEIIFNVIKTHNENISVYLLEQVAVLVANVSSVSEARDTLVHLNAPVVLLRFLQYSCTDVDVMRRLQQKAIIGLSRLCGDIEAAKQIVDIGGVEKLVQLCRDKNLRFGSDAVLVAALATLRKIVEACGIEVVNEEDAQELIQPRLLDSFMTYSTQSESLV